MKSDRANTTIGMQLADRLNQYLKDIGLSDNQSERANAIRAELDQLKKIDDPDELKDTCDLIFVYILGLKKAHQANGIFSALYYDLAPHDPRDKETHADLKKMIETYRTERNEAKEFEKNLLNGKASTYKPKIYNPRSFNPEAIAQIKEQRLRDADRERRREAFMRKVTKTSATKTDDIKQRVQERLKAKAADPDFINKNKNLVSTDTETIKQRVQARIKAKEESLNANKKHPVPSTLFAEKIGQLGAKKKSEPAQDEAEKNPSIKSTFTPRERGSE